MRLRCQPREEGRACGERTLDPDTANPTAPPPSQNPAGVSTMGTPSELGKKGKGPRDSHPLGRKGRANTAPLRKLWGSSSCKDAHKPIRTERSVQAHRPSFRGRHHSCAVTPTQSQRMHGLRPASHRSEPKTLKLPQETTRENLELNRGNFPGVT